MQVYDAAACLAKYLDSILFQSAHCSQRSSRSNQPMCGRTVVELGAGTGVVGIMAGYLGASVIITDLESLVPLLDHNVNENRHLLGAGSVVAKPLCWGNPPDSDMLHPDFLVLANCVYYESSLENLRETVLALTSEARSETVILACYEERTKEIGDLICRWHSMLSDYFDIRDIERDSLDTQYLQDFVRIVIMSSRTRHHEK